jgi:hypothetical protein
MAFFILMEHLRDNIDLLNKKEYVDKIHPNLGEKYKYIDKNLYENKFLQNLLSDIPAYKGQLNLKGRKKQPPKIAGAN